jgi:hypothetical protein
LFPTVGLEIIKKIHIEIAPREDLRQSLRGTAGPPQPDRRTRQLAAGQQGQMSPHGLNNP